MLDRILTEKIKACALDMGMDLIGYAPSSRWEKAPFMLTPSAILEGAKSVAVMGIYITDTWAEMGGEPNPHHVGPGGWMDQNSLLDRTCYRLVRLIEESGYNAIGIASSNIWRYRKMDGIDSWFTPDLSHIHASAAAGLTEIGWSGLAISPEYGPRVRYISVITDAELLPTPLYNGAPLCDMCGECIRHCPTQALSRDFDGQPHVVDIEGKKFRYANKNIWRCAWAEHFNLRLDSETLKLEHIGEDTIKAEIATKGEYHHERGVCQKVCLPPHLRTDEPSFGREGKNIRMFKMGRRYPENMPTYRKLRDDAIALAVKKGVEICSVGPIDKQSKVGQAVEAQAPGLTKVLALGFRIPQEAMDTADGDVSVRSVYSYAMFNKMHHILLNVAKFLEKEGFHAASFTGRTPMTYLGQDLGKLVADKVYVNDERNIHGNIGLMAVELAAMAGLGRIGEAFTCDEFGQFVMIGAIATDAPLDDYNRQATGAPAKPLCRPVSPAKLKNLLWAKATDNLVSMFGVAPADAFDRTVGKLSSVIDTASMRKIVVDGNVEGAYHGKWISEVHEDGAPLRTPAALLPGARSVIVLGMHIPKVILDNSGNEKTRQIGTYGFFTYQTVFELRYAALELCTMLNSMGYRTVASENCIGAGSMADSPRGLLPDFRSNAIEAVAAGLGVLGPNGALVSPEFGANSRRIVIVTDADLPADRLYDGAPLFAEDEACMSHCPMGCTSTWTDLPLAGATVRYPVIPRNRCDWAKTYSLAGAEGPRLIGNDTNVPVPHGGELSIDEICEACTHKDEILKHRTVILEPCLKHFGQGKKGG